MHSSTSLGAAELLYELFGRHIYTGSVTGWAQNKLYQHPTKTGFIERLRGYVLASENGVVVCSDQKPTIALPPHIRWYPLSETDKQIYARSWRDGQCMGRWVCVENRQVSLEHFVHNMTSNDPESDIQSLYVDSGRVKITWSRKALADLIRRHTTHPPIKAISQKKTVEQQFQQVLEAGATAEAMRTGQGNVNRAKCSGFSDEELAHCRAIYTRMRQYMPDLLTRLFDQSGKADIFARKLLAAAFAECASNQAITNEGARDAA